MGEIYTAFLEYLTVGDHPADTTSAFWPVPGIGFKNAPAIDRCQPFADSILQAKQVLFHGIGVGVLKRVLRHRNS